MKQVAVVILLFLAWLWWREGRKPLYVTHYDPVLGGINCMAPCNQFGTGEVITEGHYYDGRQGAAACIERWRGHVVTIEGLGRFVCKDTGGLIVEKPDRIHIDILSHHPVPNGLYHNWSISR